MNEQILIGILTEMKGLREDFKHEMESFKAEIKQEIADLREENKKQHEEFERRLTNLEVARQNDIVSINNILFSFERGIKQMIEQCVDEKLKSSI